MNELPPHKRSLMKRMLACGASVRAIAASVPCSTNTVKRYAEMWTLSAQCGCGRPAGHNGWCVVRLDFSPARRGYLRDRWKWRGESALAHVVDGAREAAKEQGHALGPFVWASATAASFAFALCRTCGKEVRVYQQVYRTEQYEGGAVSQPCHTIEQQQERQRWRDGKRTLLELRRMLRGRSDLRRRVSTPAPTSPRS